MLTAIPRVGALPGGVPLHRKQSGAYSSQVVEAQENCDEEEAVLEVNDASEDELGAEYQEAVAMMTTANRRRTEVDKARHFFRKRQASEDRKTRIDKLKQRLPCARCGQLGHCKDNNQCLAKVMVVNWEETRNCKWERKCATTSGVIDTACARTLAGTRWFEKFEVELKRHATLVEVVPDSETIRFGLGSVKKSSRAVIFQVAVGQNVILLRASILVKQLGSVIDVAEKTIEFRNVQNGKVPLEVVAGHVKMDLNPGRASALQKQLA